MAAGKTLYANEDRRPKIKRTGEQVDIPYLMLVLLLLAVGLIMLYSASYAQSEYDTGYRDSTRYLQKQGVCAAIGLVAMYFFSRIPSHYLLRRRHLADWYPGCDQRRPERRNDLHRRSHLPQRR